MGIREVNEIVRALGCCHFERLVDDKWLDELEEKGNLEWI